MQTPQSRPSESYPKPLTEYEVRLFAATDAADTVMHLFFGQGVHNAEMHQAILHLYDTAGAYKSYTDRFGVPNYE